MMASRFSKEVVGKILTPKSESDFEVNVETLADVNKYLKENSAQTFISLAAKYNLEALDVKLPVAVKDSPFKA
jgi:hypothetical protein